MAQHVLKKWTSAMREVRTFVCDQQEEVTP